MPLCPQLHQADETEVDNLLLGMSSQIAEREDNIVVEDLQGLHFLALHWDTGGTLSVRVGARVGRQVPSPLAVAPNLLLRPASVLLMEVQGS